MIYVDPRAGSKELVAPLTARGLPVQAETLAFGDLAWISRERKVVGVEFKTLSECVDALRSGRLVGYQLPGMFGPQGIYDVAWLLVEGEWKAGDGGAMLVPKWRRRGHLEWTPMPGGMSADEYLKRLNTLIQRHGLNVWPSQNRDQTLAWIQAQYRWWEDGEHAHDSGTALYQRPIGIGFTAVSDPQRAIAAWPGVGLKWSSAALATFLTVEGAATASTEAWASLEHAGKRFGNARAERLRQFLQGQG